MRPNYEINGNFTRFNGNWIGIHEMFGNYFVQFLINDDLSIDTGRILHRYNNTCFYLKKSDNNWAFTYMFVHDKLKAREAELSDTLNFVVAKYLEQETPYIENLSDDF